MRTGEMSSNKNIFVVKRPASKFFGDIKRTPMTEGAMGQASKGNSEVDE